MKKKNWKEMTFKEFWVEVKKRGASEIVEDPNFGMLQILHKEGFSDNQINEMRMEKIMRFYRDSLSEVISNYLTSISILLKQEPNLSAIVDPFLEKIEKILDECEEKKE